MKKCKSLKHVSLNISKLKRLEEADFSDCGALTEVSLNDSPNGVAMATDNHHSKLPTLDEASPSPEEDNIWLSFDNCFNLNQTVKTEKLILRGEEVPSYFTYQTSKTYPAEEGTYSCLTIPLFPSFLLQPFFRFKIKEMGFIPLEDLNDDSSAKNGLGNPNSLPHVCEADEDIMVNDECHETEQGEECGDNSADTERCWKRMRTT
ncbi:unnamed protein product [Microthlaspi erraticum]|uniref:Uncharacterized protein n=1 Tax=Microthlaspi erraticum TaxID=1685480 RepID=A0A6D2LE47_9BRAS|nr:unnamed protein product [Microthlaspi erraticum]